jgi:flagellar FliL protein
MATDDDLDLDVEQPKASKKKLIIIIAAAAVLLIGGGVTTWLLLSGSEDSDKGEAAGQAQTEAAKKGPVTYHDMAPVFVVSLPGKHRLLQVGLVLRYYNPELTKFLTHNDPALRNKILDILAGQDAEALKTRKGKDALRGAIKDAVNALIVKYKGKGKVEDVLYSSFVTQ